MLANTNIQARYGNFTNYWHLIQMTFMSFCDGSFTTPKETRAINQYLEARRPSAAVLRRAVDSPAARPVTPNVSQTKGKEIQNLCFK
jgi:hypothetical protein